MDRARSHTIGPNHLYIAQYSVCLYLTWRSPCNPESKFHQHFPNRISFYYVTFIIAFSMPPQHVYNSQKLKKWNLRPSFGRSPCRRINRWFCAKTSLFLQSNGIKSGSIAGRLVHVFIPSPWSLFSTACVDIRGLVAIWESGAVLRCFNFCDQCNFWQDLLNPPLVSPAWVHLSCPA